MCICSLGSRDQGARQKCGQHCCWMDLGVLDISLPAVTELRGALEYLQDHIYCFYLSRARSVPPLQLEADLQISPHSPLVTTALQENGWVCGEPDAALARSMSKTVLPRACRRPVVHFPSDM